MTWATRADYPCQAMTDQERLDWQRSFAFSDLPRIQRGARAGSADGQWHVFQEGETVYCHLTGSGFCLYRVKLKGSKVAAVWVNSHPEELPPQDREWHLATLGFIFDQLLLGKPPALSGTGEASSPGRLARRPLHPGSDGIQLSREPLQDVPAEMLAYGARDTGEMSGGDGSAILAVAGPDLERQLRLALAITSRQIGDVAFTAPGELESRGVQAIAHLISIIKATSQGAWCPHPERLSQGVRLALEFARHLELHTVAFSALGTVEGRVPKDVCAQVMLKGVRRYQQDFADWPIQVTFALPACSDYSAFEQALS